jgi:hypothetical protein
VLHVGNVANNGYLNAKLLNDAGCDCDVLAYAHYHTMGCPEWEESDFEGVIDAIAGRRTPTVMPRAGSGRWPPWRGCSAATTWSMPTAPSRFCRC